MNVPPKLDDIRVRTVEAAFDGELSYDVTNTEAYPISEFMPSGERKWDFRERVVRLAKELNKKRKANLDIVAEIQIPYRPVLLRDALTCADGVFLNDEVISYFVQQFMCACHANLDGDDKNIMVMNMYFWSILIGEFVEIKKDPTGRIIEAPGYNYQRVKNWWSRAATKYPNVLRNPLAMKKIILHINVKRQHWVSVLIFPKKRVLEYIDSAGGGCELASKYLFIAFRWLRDEAHYANQIPPDADDYRFFYRRLEHQLNGFDCGIFMVLWTMYVLDNRDLREVNQDLVTRFRVDLFCQLTKKWYEKNKERSETDPPPAEAEPEVIEVRTPSPNPSESPELPENPKMNNHLTEENLKDFEHCGFLERGYEDDPYYEDFHKWGYLVVDVKGDGNCGYYAVFLGLVNVGTKQFSKFDGDTTWKAYLVKFRKRLQTFMRTKMKNGFYAANAEAYWFKINPCGIETEKELREEIDAIYDKKLSNEQYTDSEFVNRTNLHMNPFLTLVFISMMEGVRFILFLRTRTKLKNGDEQVAFSTSVIGDGSSYRKTKKVKFDSGITTHEGIYRMPEKEFNRVNTIEILYLNTTEGTEVIEEHFLFLYRQPRTQQVKQQGKGLMDRIEDFAVPDDDSYTFEEKNFDKAYDEARESYVRGEEKKSQEDSRDSENTAGSRETYYQKFFERYKKQYRQWLDEDEELIPVPNLWRARKDYAALPDSPVKNMPPPSAGLEDNSDHPKPMEVEIGDTSQEEHAKKTGEPANDQVEETVEPNSSESIQEQQSSEKINDETIIPNEKATTRTDPPQNLHNQETSPMQETNDDLNDEPPVPPITQDEEKETRDDVNDNDEDTSSENDDDDVDGIPEYPRPAPPPASSQQMKHQLEELDTKILDVRRQYISNNDPKTRERLSHVWSQLCKQRDDLAKQLPKSKLKSSMGKTPRGKTPRKHQGKQLPLHNTNSTSHPVPDDIMNNDFVEYDEDAFLVRDRTAKYFEGGIKPIPIDLKHDKINDFFDQNYSLRAQKEREMACKASRDARRIARNELKHELEDDIDGSVRRNIIKKRRKILKEDYISPKDYEKHLQEALEKEEERKKRVQQHQKHLIDTKFRPLIQKKGTAAAKKLNGMLDEQFPFSNHDREREANELNELMSNMPPKRAGALKNRVSNVTELAKLKYIPKNTSKIDPREHYIGLKWDPEAKQFEQVPLLSTKWVNYYFDEFFVQIVKSSPNVFLTVPIGSARSPEADDCPLEVKTSVPTVFKQGRRDYCLVHSLCSCLHYCGLVNESTRLLECASDFSYLSQELALQEICEKMKKLVPVIGKCQKFNMRTSSNKNKKRPLSLLDLISNQCPYPTLVIPQGKDGSVNHACCVVDDIVFDSTTEQALKLHPKSFDWICGGEGCEGIHRAIRFQGREGLPGVKVQGTFHRNIQVNW